MKRQAENEEMDIFLPMK